MSDRKNTLRTYSDRHFAVIFYDSKTKAPHQKGWEKTQPLDFDALERLDDFIQPPPNVGLLLGVAPAYLVDLDLDSEVCRALAPAFLPPTGMISGRESSPRSHWWYSARGSEYLSFTDPLNTSRHMLMEQRSGPKQQTMVAPSLHPSGEAVIWETLNDPSVHTPQALALYSYRLAAAGLFTLCYAEGIRNDLILFTAAGMAHAGWKQDEALHFFQAILSYTDDPNPADRLESVTRTFERVAQGKPTRGWRAVITLCGQERGTLLAAWLKRGTVGGRSFSLSDDGAARNLAEIESEVLRYHAPSRTWWAFNGLTWQEDTSAPFEAVSRLSQAYLTSADTATQTWGFKCQAMRQQKAIIERASHLPELLIENTSLDTNPFLFVVQNGVLNLHRQDLRGHDPADFTSKLAPVIYDPNATCPNWEKFIERAVINPQLIHYVQTMCGYVLTGSTQEREIYVLFGVGTNGKSLFTTTLADLMGSYAQKVSVDLFLSHHSSRDQATPTLAGLMGVRYIYAAEPPRQKQWEEGFIKESTSGEPYSVRPLYGKSFSYTPIWKTMVTTNYKPVITTDDQAIWNRIRLIDWAGVMPMANLQSGQRNPEFLSFEQARAIFTEERSGILNWCLKGLARWLEYGLQPPEQVTDITNDYRISLDSVHQWLDYCTERVQDKERTSLTDLWSNYQNYCAVAGVRPLDDITDLADTLLKRGYKDLKNRYEAGKRYICGVQITASPRRKEDDHIYVRSNN